jgi:hypothetical protein
MEEITCHEVVMGKLEDSINDKMFGGDMSLKAKIEKDRKKFDERFPFKEKKEKLDAFFKTNIEIRLENRKAMLSVEERNSLNAQERKNYRELKYEMDPYECSPIFWMSNNGQDKTN